MKPSRLLLRGARRGYDVLLPIFRPVTPSVRIMLVQEERTLLVYHTYASKWYFPGGGVKQGETLVEAALREAREEVGALVQSAPKLLGIYYYEHWGRSDHILVFVSDDFVLTRPSDQWEIEGRAWFALDRLPADLAFSCQRQIQDYRSGSAPHFGQR